MPQVAAKDPRTGLPVRSALLTNLEPNQVYGINIAAENPAGKSSLTDVVIIKSNPNGIFLLLPSY